MALTKIQQTTWQRARAPGSGGQAVGLDDEICTYLIGCIARDLGLLEKFPELPKKIPDFYSKENLNDLRIGSLNPLLLFERLVEICSDSDMYFACISALHKARLKYANILETQPLPTLEQVGPRGLLQYGSLAPKNLVAFLQWRKWFFDIDNRAGQETGYLFEPVIANAVGGTPITASKSPVRRHNDERKGRQVDCLIDNRAYEIKIRMTIAASGQGRWGEELTYPIDCKSSGYIPVLVVLDSTPNAKLSELEESFLSQGGEAYIGADAWEHLEDLAGDTMSHFLKNYIKGPIDNLIDEEQLQLPTFSAKVDGAEMQIEVGEEVLSIGRN